MIDGSAVAAGLRKCAAEIAARLRDEKGVSAGLATVLVGDDKASEVYIRAKGRACAGSGLAAFDIRLPADISGAGLVAEVEKLNVDDRVDGVLVQLPLPRQIDPHRVIAAIDPAVNALPTLCFDRARRHADRLSILLGGPTHAERRQAAAG